MSSEWTPSRDAALDRLSRFVGAAGRDYESLRNFDEGPVRRENVSLLSPYLRRRMLTEKEVVREVLRAHSPAAAEKFIQEVLWRTYWQGWLAQRPALWRDYRDELGSEKAELERNQDLQTRYDLAVEGKTGIECFDAWAGELVGSGYLHNHARMWFASIWMFTLRLPWVLGADFFYRHLLDADPSSNTLSWRWVAGLQTPGKHYVARASNICKFTRGRFNPVGQLDESPRPLEASLVYEREPLPASEVPDSEKPSLLLLTEDDVLGDLFSPVASSPVAVGYIDPGHELPRQVFSSHALHEAVHRLSDRYGSVPLAQGVAAADLRSTAEDAGAEQIIMMRPAVGDMRDVTAPLSEDLRTDAMSVSMIIREWDQQLFPYATAGFFRFKKQIPHLLKKLC